jgi:hypothetical protein
MKLWFDKDARKRGFKPGDKVLVFLLIPGRPLHARYFGPYGIESNLSDVNYVVTTPGRRKEKRVCHFDMLKEYFDRCDQTSIKSVSTLDNVETLETCTENTISVESSEKDFIQSVRLKNFEIVDNLDAKLRHLVSNQRKSQQL